MATAPLPRPSLWQRTKRLIDKNLSRANLFLSRPIAAEEIEIAPAPMNARMPQPANAGMVPAVFLEGFAQIFEEIQPNFRQVVYHLKAVNVAWHGTVIQGMRVFQPSLPQP